MSDESKLSKLSEQHQRFVLNYVDTLNATKSYQAVYPDSSAESSRRSASLLMTNIDVKEALDEQFKLRAMPKFEILNRLEAIAKIDINEYTDNFGNLDFAKLKEAGLTYMIKGISDTKFGKNFILHDQADALKTLAKIVRLYDDKADVNVNINAELQADKQLNDKLSQISNRLEQSFINREDSTTSE